MINNKTQSLFPQPQSQLMSLHLSWWKKWNTRRQAPNALTPKSTIFPTAKPIHSAFLPVAVDEVRNSKGETCTLILPSQSHTSTSDRWKLNYIQISNDKQTNDHFFFSHPTYKAENSDDSTFKIYSESNYLSPRLPTDIILVETTIISTQIPRAS